VRKAKSAVSRGLATEALRVQHKLELFHPRVIEGIRALAAEAA